MTRSLLERMGGRRWLTALGLTAVSTWLAYVRILTGDAWVTFQTFLYGIFAFANVSQRGIEAAREVRMPSTQAPVAPKDPLP